MQLILIASFLCVVKSEIEFPFSKYLKNENGKISESIVENKELCERQCEYYSQQLARNEYWAVYS